MIRKSAFFVFVLLLATCFTPAMAQEESKDIPEVFLTVKALVTDLYSSVSYEIGNPPDWDYVRSHFHPDAVIVLRTSRTESKMFNLDGFIQDFVDFVTKIDPEKNSFKEEVESIKIVEYGNIAQCYVIYKASIPTTDRPGQRGLDCWHLMKENGRWWIISVVNDIEPIAGPFPEDVYGK